VLDQPDAVGHRELALDHGDRREKARELLCPFAALLEQCRALLRV